MFCFQRQIQIFVHEMEFSVRISATFVFLITISSQILTCRNGRIFNGNSCVSPTSYVCPGVVGHNVALKINCVHRECTEKCHRDGFFADYDSRCKNYYFCVNGIQTKLSCAPHLVFDENEGICVPQDRYQCPQYCSSSCS